MTYTKLGRIRPVYSGEWSSGRDYAALEMVKRADGGLTWIARRDVPAGTPPEDGEYWAVVLDVREALAAVQEAADRADGVSDGKANALSASAAGNPVQFRPDAGSMLKPVLAFGPLQSGSGDPSPDNIRPLIGRTGMKLTHNGAEYSLNFGRSVFGGVLDWHGGALAMADPIRELDGTESWYKASSAPNTFYFDYYNSGNTAGAPSLLREICSHYRTAESTVYGSAIAYYPLSYTGAILRHMFTDSRFDDLAAWKAYLAQQKAAGTPVQVTEQKIAPVTGNLDLQPQQIIAAEGVNTLRSDAGEITVRYNKSLSAAFEEMKNAILAMGGNV